MISHESAVENGRQCALITNDVLQLDSEEEKGDGDSDEENTFSSSISSMDYIHTNKELQKSYPEQIVGERTNTQCSSSKCDAAPLTESTVSSHHSHSNSQTPLKCNIIKNKDETEREKEEEALSDDNMAQKLSHLMSSGESLGAALKVGLSLAERTSLIESIMLYSRHVPNCVVADLVAEVINEQDSKSGQQRKSFNLSGVATKSVRRSSFESKRRESFSSRKRSRKPMTIPHSTSYECALLFVDISGFTAISRLLDVESLSKVWVKRE